MKTSLVVVVSVLLMNSIYGQSYHRLIQPNKSWDILHCSNPPGICNYTSGYRYYFMGDTVISGITYNTVYTHDIRNIYPGPYCPPYGIDTSSTSPVWWISMREDTLTRKVYMYDHTRQMEDLMYDFTLQPGDTLKSFYSGFPVVLDVHDTILLSGDTVKFFGLDLAMPMNYIEGIGGSQGICGPLFPFEGCADQKCVTENGTHLWGNECFPFLTSISQHIEYDKKIEIFPNPTMEFIELKRNSDTEILISIFDMTGRPIMTSTSFEKSVLIDISTLPAGSYIYTLLESDQQITCGKLIKLEN
jgi:hypothetical protein